MKFALKKLVPAKTDIKKLFLFLLVYSNSFAFIAYARTVNLLTKLFSLWDMISVLAYDFMFALIEAIFVLILLILLALILPKWLLGNNFLVLGAIWFLALTIFSFPLITPLSARGLDIFHTPIFDLENFKTFFAVWVFVVVAIGIIFHWLLSKEIFLNIFIKLVDRFTVLGMLFLGVDLFSIILVLFRNIFQSI